MVAVLDRARRAVGSSSGAVVLEEPGAHRRKARLGQLAVSAVVLVSSVLVGWLLVRSQAELAEVWVTQERVDAGSRLEVTDVVLRSVDVGSTLGAIEGSVTVVGRTARLAVPAGSTLVEGHFFDGGDSLAAVGAAQMSLTFDVGRITDSVQRNDVLRIVVVPEGEAGELEVFDRVPVLAVAVGERSGFLVTIDVDVATADRLVLALSNGEAWASVVGRQ